MTIDFLRSRMYHNEKEMPDQNGSRRSSKLRSITISLYIERKIEGP